MNQIAISEIEAIISEDDYLAGVRAPITHVLGKDGVIYDYFNLSGGRECLVKVGETGVKSGVSQLKETLNLLPNGKIPYRHLQDIVQFFREVMGRSGSKAFSHGDYEAMAHIIWSPELNAYRVAIPTQRVSKASVSYDWDHIDESKGEYIALDIHSHNTMSAFFSGTDDNDDRLSYGISGVAGKLEQPVPAFVWRLNIRQEKREITISDIFEIEVPARNPEIDTWLGKVTTGFAASRSISYGLGTSQYGIGRRDTKSLEEIESIAKGLSGAAKAELLRRLLRVRPQLALETGIETFGYGPYTSIKDGLTFAEVNLVAESLDDMDAGSVVDFIVETFRSVPRAVREEYKLRDRLEI